MLFNLLPCGAVTYLKVVVLCVGLRTLTVMMKPFRMTLKNQKGETGRAIGRVCWGAATASNREMWWVHSWLLLIKGVDNSGVEVTCVFFYLTFRGKVGRGGFSLWMTMQWAITSLTWWEHPPPTCFLFFGCSVFTSARIWIVQTCVPG